MSRNDIPEKRKEELITKIRMFLEKRCMKELSRAANEGRALEVDFADMDKFSPDLGDTLISAPSAFLELCQEAVGQIQMGSAVKVRFKGLPEPTNIRDLRARHIGRFVCAEGVVRKASEVRPEITHALWQCPECGDIIKHEAKGNFIFRPFKCECGNRDGFKQAGSAMIDTRMIVMEEPFELTEGERPSQVAVRLRDDLVSPEGRRMSDPGNRVKVTGELMEIPKGKLNSARLDFFIEANHVEPTEMGWERLVVSKEDEERIKEIAKMDDVYSMFVASMAPSIYGLSEIKEAIILQLFGGVPRAMKDGTHIRGDIHVLLVGDPSSGKSQLLKLVPEIVPRGKYVSGKGVTGAGLCMSHDTLIHSAHGEIRRIGDIVEDALKEGSEPISSGPDTGYMSKKGDFEVVCLDRDTLKMKKMRVSRFFKLRPRGSLVRITTRTGREIKLTQENPVLVMRNGETAWVQAREIAAGDHVATARFLPVNELEAHMGPDFARFLGMVEGDGDVGRREVRFHNGSESYLNGFSSICSGLGFKPRKYYRKDRVACVRVASKELCDRIESIGVPRGREAGRTEIPREVLMSNELLSSFLSGIFDCDGCVVRKGNGSYIGYTTTSRVLAQQMQTSLLRFGIVSKMRIRPPAAKGSGRRMMKHEIIIRGRENLEAFRKSIGFTFEKAEKLDSVLSGRRRPNTNVDIIPGIGERLGLERKALGIRIKNDKELYLLRHYEHGRRDFSRQQLLRLAEILSRRKQCGYFDYLKKLSQSDIFWDRVTSAVEEKEEWVFDLTVEGEHNFIANDFIVHNTATVTKDEQFMGGWVLEAGALVLANKGLLSIDEFEKMNQDDQVAMHEALEQGSISIAKASIVATLPAKTSVLAGGNPKFSRFDPYMPIAKQITIPDTLLSRFDLKFALRDLPDSETDKRIVDHILGAREPGHKESTPILESDFIRKYISYARERCKPELTPEAGKFLRNFYIKTRKKAEGTNMAIPITLRQFEAMIRLSEASAKIQLQDRVRKEDAQRAIKLMRFSLKQLGFDPETGQIDVDRAEGASTTATERGRIKSVLDIINDLAKTKKEVLVEDIRSLAAKDGIEEVDEIIEKLKREGMLFEPSPGYVQKV
jgi:replicative DNA helicase Mcm